MGVRVTIGDHTYEAVGYSVQEEASPIAAGDSAGAVGSFSITIPAPDSGLRGTPVYTAADAVYREDPDDPGTFIPRS